MDAPTAAGHIERLHAALSGVVRGQKTAIDHLVTALLAGGHVLLEDVPGVGKTTLAKALAASLGLEFSRIQFTPDLLPGDILGSSIFRPDTGSFTFRAGPIFAQLVLADEVNRASPRTQSALLEAMDEHQVTVDGETRPLPAPFFVVATQNPVDFEGTYPLPEAQLDRFLLRISMGYPSEDNEVAILEARHGADPLSALTPLFDGETLSALQAAAQAVTMSSDIARYVVRIVQATRKHGELRLGASPRGALALAKAAKARALVQGRRWVEPGDIQTLAEAVLSHRLTVRAQARYAGRTGAEIVAEIVRDLPIPT